MSTLSQILPEKIANENHEGLLKHPVYLFHKKRPQTQNYEHAKQYATSSLWMNRKRTIVIYVLWIYVLAFFSKLFIFYADYNIIKTPINFIPLSLMC